MSFQKIDMSTLTCCTGDQGINVIPDAPWISGRLLAAGVNVPLVNSRLTFRDTLGSWKARWDINRMNYRVEPGLYGVGHPDSNSPVLVTANYKMSFDRLRCELNHIDAWIMVLDTKGVNVWCAAGKGTFGTAEIVERIARVKLDQVVSHRTIIIPQLGAPGIAAHQVRQQSGFKVIYGPVRAEDLPAFLKAGMKAAAEMRRVHFNLADRLVLIPVEIVSLIRPLSIVSLLLLMMQLAGLFTVSWSMVYPFLGAALIGGAVVPALLPLIPGRSFAWKGCLLGIIWAILVVMNEGLLQAGFHGILQGIGYVTILPAISTYLALNFTGASTYTSLSGVSKEMKIAVPAMLAATGVGILSLFMLLFI